MNPVPLVSGRGAKNIFYVEAVIRSRVVKKIKIFSISVKQNSISTPYIYVNFFKEMLMKNNHQNPAQYEWGPFPFGDGTRILDIRYDPVFKAVFTRDTAKSRGALSDLISALIGRVVKVETITANEPPIDDLRQRYLRFDVACKTEKDEPVNVEMSFNPRASEPVRLEYHAARLFTGQDIHGKEKMYDDLKETYQIAILAKDKFFQDEKFTHNFLYYDPDNLIPLGGKTRIITVELVKTKPIADKPVEEMTNAEAWAVFFQYLTDEEKKAKIIEIINHEEGIAMAVDTLIHFTQDEIEYARMSSLLKGELDWNTGINDARCTGLKEGFTKGRMEADIEYARKMKADNMSLSQISKYTGLSTETISQL
jgi:predicted transposase/invertase (TIGR01784 family)